MEVVEKGPNVDTMGGCMLAGELEIRKIGKKAILIVGDTRVGKSTLFNLLLKIPLVGVEIEDGVDVIYEHQFQEGVATKNSYKSVTLVPNVGQVNIGGELTTLVDLAGFSDEARSYVGIFGVSFMLQKILEVLSEFKFVLAIAHPNFQMPKVQDFIKPFLSFIRILHIEVLLEESHQQIAQKFINSISVAVIKSTRPQKFYLSKMLKILQHLEAGNALQNDRKLIKMILRSIHDNSRIQLFKKAEPDQRPAQCEILQRLNTGKHWDFYKFQDNLPKQVLFLLPFQKQHAEMKDTDKNQYKNDFQAKSKKMKKSYQILQKFFQKAKSNWYSTDAIDYSSQFDELAQIIDDHPYGSFNLMLKQLQIQFSIGQNEENIVSRLDLLDRFKQIQKASQEINDLNQITEAHVKIHAMIKPCFEIFNIFRKMVCTNRELEEKFIIFMFINMRFLHESQMQNKVDKNQGSGIPFIVTQHISNILPTSCENLNAQFFLKFKEKENEKEKFTELLQELLKEINSIADADQARQLLYVNINISVKAAKKFIKKGCFKEGIEQLLIAHKDFQNFKQFLPQQSEISKEDKSITQYKSLQIYDLIGTCLQNLNFHRHAVNIYTFTKSISHLMRCYEKKIQKQNKRKKKFELYEDYIQILQKNKKIQKTIQTIQKMIDTFRCFPEKRTALIEKLTTIKQNKEIKQKGQEIESIDLHQLIQSIESDLAYHVDQFEDDDEESEDEDDIFEHRNDELQKSDQGSEHND